MTRYEFRMADYRNPDDAAALSELLYLYSGDEMGGAAALPKAHCAMAAEKLDAFGQAFTVLAFDSSDTPAVPVGMATCLMSFSTFSLRAIVNIHDFFVRKSARGSGVAMKLLEAVEAQAVSRQCCKITLEVLSNNERAKRLYKRFGFNAYELTETAGTAHFWQKSLP